ncbi:MAG: cation:proton antiporter [Gammaproteobacteria bacterium]|nr:cation:proton antiporter [Gammaproteobacteria bacterium]NIM72636.1 cation:proton antiporter [Gammaproteobacteria bacterium]NIN37693.1 cation:proton antiporter [Gammaproteobacteria bacterium]NIO24397.1 cation:proton antiporter [Gammaproteobacteria bacterium]NIO65000.1 cation:proton antiporter [Gammaproteobacteria bacterium]
METIAIALITLGGIMLLGLVTDLLGRHTPLPRVTLLLAFGFLIGPSGTGLLPEIAPELFYLLSSMALVMIGFLIGGTLTRQMLRRHGRRVLTISATMVLVTLIFVGVGLTLIGVPIEVALLLAGISTATAPAATADVVHEIGAEGPFSQTLLGMVAIDDAWGLIAFTLVLAFVHVLNGDGATTSVMLHGLWELVGALALGALLGVPMAYLSGRISAGEPLQAEALGMVFLCGGLALWLEVSFILAAMVMGAVVTNLARHHRRPFHAIEGIEWPFLVLFFVLAGASLEIDALWAAGAGLLGYLVLRVLGRLAGAWLGGSLCGVDAAQRWWLGLAMLPQAGVALGMALIAAQHLPTLGQIIIPVVVGATVIFEIAGPVLTRMALRYAGEVPNAAHSTNGH